MIFVGSRDLDDVAFELISSVFPLCHCTVTWDYEPSCDAPTTAQVRINGGPWSAPVTFNPTGTDIARPSISTPYVAFREGPSAESVRDVYIYGDAASTTLIDATVRGGGIEVSFPENVLPVELGPGDSVLMRVAYIGKELTTSVSTIDLNTTGCSPAASLRILHDTTDRQEDYLTLLSPNGGEVYTAGDLIVPEWIAGGDLPPSWVEVSVDSGRTWNSVPYDYDLATGELRLPFVETDQALARVRTSAGPMTRKILQRRHSIESIDVGLGNSAFLLTERSKKKVDLVDLVSGQLLATIPNVEDDLSAYPKARFAPSTEEILLQGYYVWDLFAGDVITDLSGYILPQISGDWSRLLTRRSWNPRDLNYPDTIDIRDLKTLEPVDTLVNPCGRRSLQTEDGRLFVMTSCTEDSLILIDRLAGTERAIKIREETDPDVGSLFRIDTERGRLIAVTRHVDGSLLRLWNIEDLRLLHDLSLTSLDVSIVNDLESLDGERIVLVGQNRINVLDLSDTTVTTRRVPTGIHSHSLSQNRRFILTGDDSGGVFYHKLDTLPTYIDLSDNVWRIVMPQPMPNDIYLGEIESGDYLVTARNVLYNRGTVGFTIDTAYFDATRSDSGLHALSHPEQRVMPGDSVPVGIRFNASELGRRRGVLVLEYQGGEKLEVGVTADVIESTLMIGAGNTLDFPTILRLHHHDSSLALLSNSTDQSFTIDSIRIIGPDRESFVVAGRSGERLGPFDTLHVTPRFAPQGIGLHAGRLEVWFAHRYGAVSLELRGGGVPEKLATGDTTVPFGTIFDLPLILAPQNGGVRGPMAASWRGRIAFDTTYLLPYAVSGSTGEDLPLTWKTEEGRGVITIDGTYRFDGDQLSTLRFLARRRVAGTPIEIREFSWLLPERAWGLDTSITGIVRITGEGPGLYTSSERGDVWGILTAYPNPADDVIHFDMAVGEEESVTIEIYNAIGARVRLLWNGPMKEGVYNLRVDCRDLPSGAYYIRVDNGRHTSLRKWLVVQ